MSLTTAVRPLSLTTDSASRPAPQGLVLIVSDNPSWGQGLDVICDFFGLALEQAPSELDVGFLLREFRPMAVIAEADGQGQDGFHVMRAVAEHDASLPMLLLTGGEPGLAGAAEAMQEITGLSNLRVAAALPSIAETIDFLFRAGRRAGIGRMMPVSA